MPTYEYRCAHCDRTFDVVQSFTDDPLTECPECGSAVRKVFGAVGIVFKGSGFYKNDSRSGGSKPKDSTSAPSTDASSSTSSDTPAPKEGSADSSKPAASDSGNASNTPTKATPAASTPSSTP